MRMLMLPADVTLEGRQPALVSWRDPAPDPSPEPPSSRRRAASPPGSRSGAAARPTGRRRPVTRVLDRWRYDGRWWEREIHRDYFLLELRGGAVIELYREEDAWWVARASD